MKNLYIVTLMIISTKVLTFAQDARYTQAYGNPLNINPSIMGANSDMKFILNYRNQWASMDKGYSTYSFTGISPVFLNKGRDKFDIGLCFMKDKAGAFSTLNMGLAIDYNKEISPNNNLCLSLIGGFEQKSLDASKLSYDSQYILGSYNSSNPTNEVTFSDKTIYPELGFGFMWYFNPSRDKAKLNAFAGFSAYHLNQPNETFLGSDGKLPMRFNYQAGIKVFGNNRIDISPNIRVNMQNGNIETAAGLYVDYNFNDNVKLVIGGWYRTHDAIAFLVGLEHKNFLLGYSYDIVNSNLNRVVNGANAHEITVAYKLSRIAKSAVSVGDEKGAVPAGEFGKTKPLVTTSPFSSF